MTWLLTALALLTPSAALITVRLLAVHRHRDCTRCRVDTRPHLPEVPDAA